MVALKQAQETCSVDEHGKPARPARSLLDRLPDREALVKLADGKSPGANDREMLSEAQQLVYDAWEERDGRRRSALARRALALSPLCADALLILADLRSLADEDRRELLERALLAGELAIGKRAFREDKGHFWAVLETRPYMRARHALAEDLWRCGEERAAVAHLREMLVLNPGDNQGLRYRLLVWLLRLGDDRAVERLLRAHGREASAFMDYTRALMVFRRSGDSDQSRRAVARAWESNRHVPRLLRARRGSHENMAYYSLGGEDEAAWYVGEYGFAWERAPGAIAWLTHVTHALERAAEGGPSVH